ncbi:ATP-binding protein [Piscinibacter gummiphilus]|uniref:histidine kinase n=1 Tax=Piscinibacter gummiphilus TaxID=946333 RepID=A0ABZ0CLV0_9BURK|nr:ATP-binding protein [Piscinibacter gummiphilus]WOB05958.1 ATP-binding protein [Piscinibacter gummiphilus]
MKRDGTMKLTTLQSQLTRASLLTTFLVLLVCSAALLTYEYITSRSNWAAEMRTQADFIAHNSAAALVFNDPRAAQENLSLLHLQQRIHTAAIYDKDGRVFAFFRAQGQEPLPSTVDPALLRAGVVFSGSSMTLAYPIRHEDERVGTVYIEGGHDMLGRIATYGLILIAVMSMGLGIAVLFFNRLLRRVARPLDEMTQVAQEVMTKRAWGLRARETEYQDIGVLVNAFNNMLAEVQARTSELEVEMAERVRAEQGLRQADRRKDEFLATLAHELRNPLAPMTTALALIRREKSPPEVREKSMAILQRQLAQLVRLIDDLLDVSRVSTGKLSLRIERVELVDLLRGTVEMFQGLAGDKGLSLSFEEPGITVPLAGDAARLAQVFSNLLTNACRYTPLGGRIAVSVSCTDDMVEVAVQDSGLGIEPALQHRIFDLFEQGDKSLERGSAGLGIGLTLARQLVQLHGGEITVYSAGRNKGSRFMVRLPLEPVDRLPSSPTSPTTSSASSPEPRPAASAARPMRLLVADDNVDFATSLAELLRGLGHTVEVVHDGAAALAAAKRHPPEVALLDIGMPHLNGYELARKLRAERDLDATLLVAITGWGQARDREEAMRAGFDHHLTKPVDPAVLGGLLANAAERQPEAPPAL